MALEVAIVDEFRQNDLVIDGDGAGVEACLRFVKGHAGPGKDEVAGADVCIRDREISGDSKTQRHWSHMPG